MHIAQDVSGWYRVVGKGAKMKMYKATYCRPKARHAQEGFPVLPLEPPLCVSITPRKVSSSPSRTVVHSLVRLPFSEQLWLLSMRMPEVVELNLGYRLCQSPSCLCFAFLPICFKSRYEFFLVFVSPDEFGGRYLLPLF